MCAKFTRALRAGHGISPAINFTTGRLIQLSFSQIPPTEVSLINAWLTVNSEHGDSAGRIHFLGGNQSNISQN